MFLNFISLVAGSNDNLLLFLLFLTSLNTSTSDSTKTDELSPDDDVNSEKPVKREIIN